MTDLEAEREQKQRDFDRKLLLAKSKIEMEEASVTAGPQVQLSEPCSINQELGGVNKPWGQESKGLGAPAPALALKGCVAVGKSTSPCLSFLSKN